jgi:hypothetical protein|tara:strand:+ start:90 stop:536 length:447 start_codon:yes stop_codon:yes gene_type:complete
MQKRVPKSEIIELLKQEFDTGFVNSLNINKFDVITTMDRTRLYVSQSKPSKNSKGHWKYDFFHTITFSILEEVLDGLGKLVLVNYVDRIYTVLKSSDIAWVIRYSSREKGYDEEVTDFVIEKDADQNYVLRPYDRFNHRRRTIKIKPF